MVLGKCDKKYAITSLPIFNIERGVEAETRIQWNPMNYRNKYNNPNFEKILRIV